MANDGTPGMAIDSIVTRQTPPTLEELLEQEMEGEEPDPELEEQADGSDPSESDEVEGDEPEAEDDETPESDDESEEPTEESPVEIDPEAKAFTVKIDGTEELWSLDDLIKSASREGHWTRRMQETAAKDKALDAERAALQQQASEYADILPQLQMALEAITGEPDFAELRKQLPPEQYAQAVADHQVRQQQLGRIKAERERLQQEQLSQQQKAFEEYGAKQRSLLLDAIPTWRDEKVAKQEIEGIVAFAKSQGWTPEELDTLSDHRAIKILRMAWMHDKVSKKAPDLKKKVALKKPAGASKAKVTSPGKPKPRNVTVHTQRDAQALFENILAAEDRPARRR